MGKGYFSHGLQRFQHQRVTCWIISFCKVVHTQDGLIECPLLFFFVKIKTLYMKQIGTPSEVVS